MKKKHILLVWCVVFCLLMVACSRKEGKSETENAQEQVELDGEADTDAGIAPEDEKTDSNTEADGKVLPTELGYGAQIAGQCFDVNLKPGAGRAAMQF